MKNEYFIFYFMNKQDLLNLLEILCYFKAGISDINQQKKLENLMLNLEQEILKPINI